jgi:F-type H+-transporting ATPase subunit alpha
MRLELAQYTNLAAFAQFGSELDEATSNQLERGKRTIEMLKQPQYSPLSESLEYLSIYLVTSGSLDKVPVEKVQDFESEYHEFMKRKNQKILDELSEGKKPSEELTKKIEKSIQDFRKTFS